MRSIAVKENILALLVAFVLSFILFFLINRFEFLKADIVANENNAEKIKGDVFYNFSGDVLEMMSNKDIEGLQSVSLVVSYDNSKVQLKKDNISSKYEVGYSETEENRSYIILSEVDSLKEGEKLISIKYSGEKSSINISDVTINSTNGETESLSVSNKNK